MTDTFDELRIIAKDCTGLKGNDRAVIARAADEMEQTLRVLIATNAALIESQQRRIALNDQLLDMKRSNKTFPRFPAISTGWMPVTVRNP